MPRDDGHQLDDNRGEEAREDPEPRKRKVLPPDMRVPSDVRIGHVGEEPQVGERLHDDDAC